MKRISPHSLELRKQLIILLLIVFMPILAHLLFTGYRQHQRTLTDIEDNINQLIRLFIEEQRDIVNQTRHLLTILSHVPAIRDIEIEPCNQFLRDIHHENPQYSTIVVANGHGIIECCAIPIKQPIDVSDRNWFKRINEAKSFVIDDFLISRSAQKASLPFATPVLNNDNQVIAAVGAAYDLSSYDSVFKKIPLPKDSVIFIIGMNKSILYASIEQKDMIGKALVQCRNFDIPDTPKGRLVVNDSDGVKRIYWHESLSVGDERNQVAIVIGVSEQAIFSDARRILAINLSLWTVLASLCFAMAWFFGRKYILDPVNHLVQKTRHVQQGDWTASEAPGLMPGELGILARAFDEMLENLSRKEAERDEALSSLEQEILQHKGTVAALREREEHLRILFEQAADAIYVAKPDGSLVKVNRQACRATGFSEDELLSMNVSDVDPQMTSTMFDEFARNLSVDQPATIESTHRRKDGSTFPAEITVALLQTHDGPQVLGIARDITERRKAEEDLRFHRTLLEETGRMAKVGGWRFNALTGEGIWTDEVARIHDLDPEAPTSRDKGIQYYVGESRSKIEAAVRDAVERGLPYDLELEMESELGVRKWVRTIGHPVVENGRVAYVQGSFQDITDHRQTEEALRHSLEEKVALLKEVHHRVKNNLQIVASLLSLQANRSDNQQAVDVLRDTRNRIRSMALLHETLYRSGDLASINLATYLKDLCGQLALAYSSLSGRVQLEHHVAEVGLPLDLAVPCGLIVNELVSNALKHAFPGERSGRIVVGLEASNQQRLVLSVCDDGAGLPAEFSLTSKSTLGLQLVSGLAGQLSGQLELESDDSGTRFRVVFPAPAPAPPGWTG